jgi:hypothetical protein
MLPPCSDFFSFSGRHFFSLLSTFLPFFFPYLLLAFISLRISWEKRKEVYVQILNTSNSFVCTTRLVFLHSPEMGGIWETHVQQKSAIYPHLGQLIWTPVQLRDATATWTGPPQLVSISRLREEVREIYT